MGKSEMRVYIESRVYTSSAPTTNVQHFRSPSSSYNSGVAERNTTRKNSKRPRFHRKTKAIACDEDVPGITLPIQLVSTKAVTSTIKVSAMWLVAAERQTGRMPELFRVSHTTRDAILKFNAFRPQTTSTNCHRSSKLLYERGK